MQDRRRGRFRGTIGLAAFALLQAAVAIASPIKNSAAPAGPQASSDLDAAIGRLNMGNGAYCTGALIGRDLVVTASHCLYNRRTDRWVKASSLHFLLGFRSGEYSQHARVARYTVDKNFNPKAPGENLGAGWAILVLTAPAPAGTAPLALAAGDLAGDTNTEIKGYSVRRKYALSTSSPCRTRAVSGLLLGDCKAEQGMSGAPMIDMASGAFVGIQVAGGRSGRRDVLVGVPAARLREAYANVRQ